MTDKKPHNRAGAAQSAQGSPPSKEAESFGDLDGQEWFEALTLAQKRFYDRVFNDDMTGVIVHPVDGPPFKIGPNGRVPLDKDDPNYKLN